jgi:hypothetical protein
VVDGNGKFKVQSNYFFGLLWEDFGSRMNGYAESWRPDVYNTLADAQERLERMQQLQITESRAKCLTEVERLIP